MLGLLPGYEGRICVDGTDIRTLSPAQLARHVAYIPQAAGHSFNYTVRDVVLMGTTSQMNPFFAPGTEQRHHVERALNNLQITHLRDRLFLSLSGGEQQLVLIARALVQKAKILFMDEPTANLDYGNQVRVLEQMKALTKQGYTVVQSTHSPEQAFLYADQVLAVHEGRIIADGAPRQVLNEALLRRLYNVDVCVETLHNNTVQVCIPQAVLTRAEDKTQRRIR
jgi:iron complex transport system ATP-binding protein